MMCLYVLSVIVAAYLMVKLVIQENNGVIMVKDIPILILSSIISPFGLYMGIESQIDGKKVIWREKK